MSFAVPWLLAISFVAAPSSSRPWLVDYGVALKATKQSQRPLLIVIDEQPKSLAHIEPVAEVSRSTTVALLKKYTLCHVDATTAYGTAVAKAFRTSTFPTTVIIDKTGSVQLIKKTGRLSADALVSLLATHQDGELPYVMEQPTVCRT